MAILKHTHRKEFKFQTPKFGAHNELRIATEDHGTAMDEGVGETKHKETQAAWYKTNKLDPEVQMIVTMRESEMLMRFQQIAARIDQLLVRVRVRVRVRALELGLGSGLGLGTGLHWVGLGWVGGWVGLGWAG
tara:strand:- start:881 stop:1279 length:399 start_codon:yes stop_codon:yes gene_type:complete